jgi:adenine-specific DNA methylase
VGIASWQPGEDPRAKDLGAYYTDSQVADFVIRWAVRSQGDTVADPSFGGGVFLRAAGKRLLELGGNPAKAIQGVELDSEVFEVVSSKLHDEFDLDLSQLFRDDFFALPPSALAVDAMVGNPPFIRFHSFSGEGRQRALSRAAAAGVTLSGSTSSWVPFLVHASTMLNRGGRMAMVVPAEIGYAEYAAPFVRFLSERFGSLTLVTFETPLFPHLNEETYLLLADGYLMGNTETLRVEDYRSIGELLGCQDAAATAIETEALIDRRQRLAEAFINPRAREAYDELSNLYSDHRLGHLADVGIGYVSGANSFFHLSRSEAEVRRIDESVLKPALLNSRSLSAGIINKSDWLVAEKKGDAALLLHIEEDGQLSESVTSYLAEGAEAKVPLGYKCRMRRSWYRVPGVHVPDAFLSYMSGMRPRLSINGEGFVGPNTLHTIRLRNSTKVNACDLLVWWHSSLARLSSELEGHALGGGMLKLEPREASRLVVPREVAGLGEHAYELDSLLRKDRFDLAEQLANRALSRASNIPTNILDSMGEASETLRNRRTRRGR